MTINLQDREKEYQKETHRVCHPKETVKHILDLRNKSAIPEFRNLTVIRVDKHDIFGVPVFKVLTGEGGKNDTFMPPENHGKGATEEQALASALTEFVERLSATTIDWTRVKKAKASDIPNSISLWDLVPPNEIRNKFTRESIDKKEMFWVDAVSLTTGNSVWVPIHLAYFCKNTISKLGEGNGLAAGNVLEEAILHGICEVVERHLIEVMCWNDVLPRKIDNNTIDDEEVNKLLRIAESKGYQVILHDYTNNIGIPTISAVIYHEDEYAQRFGLTLHSWNIGTHTSRKIAVIRAITEAYQGRACFLQRTPSEEQLTNRYDDIKHAKYLEKTLGNAENISYLDVPDISCNNIKSEITCVVNLLRKKGFEVIMADLTDKRIGIPVIRVLIKDLQPELRTFISEWKTPAHDYARISRHLDIYDYMYPPVP